MDQVLTHLGSLVPSKGTDMQAMSGERLELSMEPVKPGINNNSFQDFKCSEDWQGFLVNVCDIS